MENSQTGKKGTLRVSESVIVTIAKNAALEIDGVYKIPSKSFRIKSLLSSPSDPCDIRVSMTEGVCALSVPIVIKSGYNSVTVSEQIQERVKSAVQSMTGVTVAKVDVTVSDVYFDTSENA